MSSTKAKVTSTAAVTGAVALGGGVAEAAHVRATSNHSRQAAGAESARIAAADNQAAQELAVRAAASDQANRDAQRPSIAPSSSTVTNTTSSPAPPSPSTTQPAPRHAKPSTTSPTTTSTSTTPTSRPTTPSPKPTTTTPVSSLPGTNATPAQAKAIAAQIVPSASLACFSNIITRESSWDVHATNPYSGAYGLGQALPGKKMATAGSDWLNNATTQIRWALSYMDSRYGSPCSAWAFWQAHNWY